jgi:hypothetical protein
MIVAHSPAPQVAHLLAAAFLFGLAIVALLDFLMELQGEPSVGERFERWSRRYPYFGASLGALIGALLAHFFFQFPR